MNAWRWWWILLIIQLAEAEESPTHDEDKVKENNNLSNIKEYNQKLRQRRNSDWYEDPIIQPYNEYNEETIEIPNQILSTLVKRNPFLSRWGRHRLSDLLHFKRKPAFSSWGGKRGPAFSSWGGKRSEKIENKASQNINFNDSTNELSLLNGNKNTLRPTITEPDATLKYPVNNDINIFLLRKYFDELRGIDNDKLQSLFNQGSANTETEDINTINRLFLQNKMNDSNLLDEILSAQNPLNWVENKFYDYRIDNDGNDLFTDENEENGNVDNYGKPNLDEEIETIPLLDTFNKRTSPSFNSWGGKRTPAFNSWGGKRAPAFNSWGGKRAPAFNSWEGKRLPAFNSWGGKRAPAFNSWGGKRAPAFNSWGGKRAPAFNSWGGKRVPAFNSWGGKRAPAFNSWGGKRAPAFNSWGGKRDQQTNLEEIIPSDFNTERKKRSSAFNSWGGKRDTEFNPLDRKRVPAFNSWGGKRAPAFNSWGGKRDGELSVLNEKQTTALNSEDGIQNDAFINFEEKRAPAFNSWGGKRDIEFNPLDGKRTPAFNSWGGKRAPAFNSWGGKRDPAFNSWGGKRAPAFNSWGGKRAPTFNSWGGKRAPAFNSWGGKRAPAFNSWGGKRNDDGYSSLDDKRTAAFSSWGGKRTPAFKSWGGKRDNNDDEYSNFDDKRAAAFSSWGGKRATAFNSWGGKRFEDNKANNVDEKRAAAFSSWGGKRAPAFNSWGGKRDNSNYNSLDDKRDNSNYDSLDDKRATAFNSWGGKRLPAFHSWGGKRSENFNTEALKNDDINFLDLRQEEIPFEPNIYWNDDDNDKEKIIPIKNPEILRQTISIPSDEQNILTLKNENDNNILFIPNILKNKFFEIKELNNESLNEPNSKMENQIILSKREATGKRNPAFFSWGGKRNSIPQLNFFEKNNIIKRDIEKVSMEDIEDTSKNEEKRSMNKEITESEHNSEYLPNYVKNNYDENHNSFLKIWEEKNNQNYSELEKKINVRKKRNIDIFKQQSIPFISPNVINNDNNYNNDNNDIQKTNDYSTIEDIYPEIPTGTIMCCIKRVQYGDKNLFMQMLLRTKSFRDLSWPTIRPIRRGADFYSWGGKRSAL